MSAPDWQAGNDAYLVAALAWLRSALAGTGPPDRPAPPAGAGLAAGA